MGKNLAKGDIIYFDNDLYLKQTKGINKHGLLFWEENEYQLLNKHSVNHYYHCIYTFIDNKYNNTFDISTGINTSLNDCFIIKKSNDKDLSFLIKYIDNRLYRIDEYFRTSGIVIMGLVVANILILLYFWTLVK